MVLGRDGGGCQHWVNRPFLHGQQANELMQQVQVALHAVQDVVGRTFYQVASTK